VDAEAMLNGITATKDHFEAVGETIVRGAHGFGHNTFKIELTRRAVVRALQHASGIGRKA
jgi:xanthine dehydrogenase YagS FAD-binding subunit